MRTVVPRVETIICDICGKEIKGRTIPPFYDVGTVTKVTAYWWGRTRYERTELDVCNCCRQEISDFIYDKVSKTYERLGKDNETDRDIEYDF